MHGYYQKNLKKWHKTLNSYMNYISYELESLTGQSYDTLIQEIWTNYQAEMLERSLTLAEMLPAEQRTLSELTCL